MTILDKFCKGRFTHSIPCSCRTHSEHGMGMAWQVWIRHSRTV